MTSEENTTTWLRSGTKRRAADDDQELSNRRQKKMRRARTKQPRSHYTRLTDEKKSEIRPFRFLNLPSELRNQVYSYLLVASYIDEEEDEEESDDEGYHPDEHEEDSDYVEGREVLQRIFVEEDRIDTRKFGLHTSIFRTCRGIFNEARSYLSAQNNFEIRLNAFDGTESADVYFPPLQFDIGVIKSLRIQISIDLQHYPRPESHFDWSFLKDMPALETIYFAMTGFEHEWTSNRVAVNGAYRNSMFVVDGLVDNLVDGAPAHIAIRWHIWEELLKDFFTRSRRGQYYVAGEAVLDRVDS